MKNLFISAAFALSLAACSANNMNTMGTQSSANTTHPTPPSYQMPQANHNAPQIQFDCRNGNMPLIKQLSTDQIELSLNDKKAVLNIAVSGSGARYLSNTGLYGYGAQWHSKGDDAVFSFKDPYGNLVETTCKPMKS